VIDLTFPGDALRKLTPDLTELGFTAGEETTRDRLSWASAARLTVLRRTEDVVYLVHLQHDFIDIRTPKLADLQVMVFLEFFLPKTDSLVIMSMERDFLAKPIERIIDEWKGRRINVRFVPWRRLNELPPQGVGERLIELAELLGVISPGQSAGASQKKLERADEQAIINIMTDIAITTMGGANHFFDKFIRKTRLPPYMQSNALAGWKDGATEADQYARDLVNWASVRGRFTPEGENTSLTVLGEIIRVLVEDCGEDEKARLRGIASRYRLIDDLSIRRSG
jgi:hypothetical protein